MIDQKHIKAAFHEALKRYPESESALIWFFYASGLGEKIILSDKAEIMSNLVWESLLDGVWQCQVERTTEHQGTLRMFEKTKPENEIVNVYVSFSYGAQFGPDISDVSSWQNVCIDALDKIITED